MKLVMRVDDAMLIVSDEQAKELTRVFEARALGWLYCMEIIAAPATATIDEMLDLADIRLDET